MLVKKIKQIKCMVHQHEKRVLSLLEHTLHTLLGQTRKSTVNQYYYPVKTNNAQEDMVAKEQTVPRTTHIELLRD